MNEKICISIGNVGFNTCMQLASVFPLVEVRLDLMDLEPENIELLSLRCRKWVATCRPGKYSERERTVQLSASIRSGATYVDIEYESEDTYRKPLVDLAKRMGSKVIISYHDFDQTANTKYLEEIIHDSQSKGADFVKIATFAQSSGDSARIMSLYEKHDHLIAFAMGDIGKITRIAAPILGAEFTFASIDETHITAPGQLTASQMEVMLQILETSQ
ncbi:MAG: type I 3-dehydroquinate dehydratase [Bacteroidales bacterium]|jgi:3-dehydroquinate dehydratase-1|nr:type I 3-dehydroquinate dehydratase [Bacteroidales bacterium]